VTMIYCTKKNFRLIGWVFSEIAIFRMWHMMPCLKHAMVDAHNACVDAQDARVTSGADIGAQNACVTLRTLEWLLEQILGAQVDAQDARVTSGADIGAQNACVDAQDARVTSATLSGTLIFLFYNEKSRRNADYF